MLRASGYFQSLGRLRSKPIKHSAHSAPVRQFARFAATIGGDLIWILRVRRVDGRYHGIQSIIH
jgi:hypothetical protein